MTIKKNFQQIQNDKKKYLFKLIKRIAELNYYSARSFYMYQLLRGLNKHTETPIIVYQMGKVGSSTVMSSLKNIDMDRAIYHPHFLTEKRIKETEANRRFYFNTDKYSMLKRPWMCKFLRNQIYSKKNNFKWNVITLTREPIGRNISTFFENLEVTSTESEQEYYIRSDYYGIERTLVRLCDLRCLETLFFEKLNQDSPLEFFDNEIKEVFGIDVYAGEFPKSKGYKIYQNEKAQVLLIKMENLNECAKSAFKEFINIDKFTLINENIGAEKIYAPIYKKFKETVIIPDSYFEKFYSSKYVLHFYTEKEIKKYRSMWKRN